MSSKKTPEADFKRFEDFIDDMPDLEFEQRMDLPRSEGGFSTKQKELLSQMRESLDEDKLEILEERGFDVGYEDADSLIVEHRDALRNFYSKWLR